MTVKKPFAMQKMPWVRSLGREGPLEGRHGNPLQYSCLGESHGQRSLAGYSPQIRTELDTTEATAHAV